MFGVHADSKEKRDALSIIDYALKKTSIEKIMKGCVRFSGNKLKIKNREYNLKDYENIYVLGSGKASYRMASSLNSIIGKQIKEGLVIYTKKDRIGKIKIEKGTHPLPSELSFEATQKLLKVAKKIKEGDLTIYLLSGGTSSLLCYPKIGMKKFIELNRKLIKSGKNIGEINKVRIKYSKIKGGKLLKHIKGKIVNLVVSDVVGDSLKYIGSGPLYSRSKRVDNVIIANNRMLLEKAAEKARKLGYNVRIKYPEYEGPPRPLAERIISISKRMKPGDCIISGGEINVKVRGGGRGGPNQEFVLWCYKTKGTIASIDSDGIDGNTKAAGGIASERDFQKIGKKEIEKMLKENNSNKFFRKIGGEIITGPTGTNLNDLRIMIK